MKSSTAMLMIVASFMSTSCSPRVAREQPPKTFVLSEPGIRTVVSNFCSPRCTKFATGRNGSGDLIITGTAHDADLEFHDELFRMLQGYNWSLTYYPVDYFDGHSFYFGLVMDETAEQEPVSLVPREQVGLNVLP